MPLIRLTDVPPALQTWDPIPIELAREWCAVLIQRMPHRLAPTLMHWTRYEARMKGISNIAEWIWVVKEFEAAGFTPAEWLQLTLDVLDDPRTTPDRWDPEHDPYVSNSLVSLAVGSHPEYGAVIRLQAEPWKPWLERTRAGEDSLAVVSDMLEPHWGEPAISIPFGEFTLCTLER